MDSLHVYRLIFDLVNSQKDYNLLKVVKFQNLVEKYILLQNLKLFYIVLCKFWKFTTFSF